MPAGRPKKPQSERAIHEPKVVSKPIMINVGFDNMVMSDQIVALLDYRSVPMKELIKSALAERPRSVLKVTKGRRAVTLIILTGDRYVLSAIPSKKLQSRLGLNNEVRVAESSIARSEAKKERTMANNRDHGSSEHGEENDNSSGSPEDDGSLS